VVAGVGSDDRVPLESAEAERMSRIADFVTEWRLRMLRYRTAVRQVLRSRARSASNFVTESLDLELPSSAQVFKLASEVALVVGLLALLRAGVSTTLRWLHGRLDPNGSVLAYEDSVFECVQRPLEFLSVFTVGTSLAEVVSRPLVATGILRYIRVLRELGVVIAGAWFLMRWVDKLRSRFTSAANVDKSQVNAYSRVAMVIVAAIAVLIICDTIGLKLQSLLAFGGFGGLAIGFAGKEIISNFFSGFMIYVTRPFKVGEWIRSIENDQFDGIVEDVGWYLTRIQKWDKRPLYVPNSQFSTLIIENATRMTNRRIRQDLLIRIEDAPVATGCTEDLR